MARTTRSTKASATAKSSAKEATPATNDTQTVHQLPASKSDPSKIFILPTAATSEARIVSLLNPRTAKPARYLVCPETGIYEFTHVSAPKSEPRSWLIESPKSDGETTTEAKSKGESFHASISQGADLFIATPIDPLFLIIPAVAAKQLKNDEKKLFLSSDDHFDSISELSPHLSEILRWGDDSRISKLLESRMTAICDTVDAGDESMYRFNEDKLLNEILSKARTMSAEALPKSMEEKFVTKVLEAPMVGVRVRDTTTTTAATPITPADSKESTPKPTDGVDSQASTLDSMDTTTSFTSDVSMTSTAATEVDGSAAAAISDMAPALEASPEIISLQRLRVAFSYICSAYLPPARTISLKALVATKSEEIDFSPLDNYLSQIAKMREEAAASRNIGDYSRKRAYDDDELADRAEKKRVKEEEERRKKAGESRGVKNLKKVNTTGMKKMSDFFKKKA